MWEVETTINWYSTVDIATMYGLIKEPCDSNMYSMEKTSYFVEWVKNDRKLLTTRKTPRFGSK